MPTGQALCQIAACDLWAEKDIPFCNGHGKTWKTNGRPGTEKFIRGYAEIEVVPATSASSWTACPRS